jgi:hypothetical protein
MKLIILLLQLFVIPICLPDGDEVTKRAIVSGYGKTDINGKQTLFKNILTYRIFLNSQKMLVKCC